MPRNPFLDFQRAAEAAGYPALLIVSAVSLGLVVVPVGLLGVTRLGWVLAVALLSLIAAVAILAAALDAALSDVEDPPTDGRAGAPRRPTRASRSCTLPHANPQTDRPDRTARRPSSRAQTRAPGRKRARPRRRRRLRRFVEALALADLSAALGRGVVIAHVDPYGQFRACFRRRVRVARP